MTAPQHDPEPFKLVPKVRKEPTTHDVQFKADDGSGMATSYKDYGGVDHEHTRDTHTHGNIVEDTLDLVTGPDYKRRNTVATTPGLPFQRPKAYEFPADLTWPLPILNCWIGFPPLVTRH